MAATPTPTGDRFCPDCGVTKRGATEGDGEPAAPRVQSRRPYFTLTESHPSIAVPPEAAVQAGLRVSEIDADLLGLEVEDEVGDRVRVHGPGKPGGAVYSHSVRESERCRLRL
jgi:hypothetical protein